MNIKKHVKVEYQVGNIPIYFSNNPDADYFLRSLERFASDRNNVETWYKEHYQLGDNWSVETERLLHTNEELAPECEVCEELVEAIKYYDSVSNEYNNNPYIVLNKILYNLYKYNTYE